MSGTVPYNRSCAAAEAESILLRRHGKDSKVVVGGGLWRYLQASIPSSEVHELRLVLGCSAALDKNSVILFVIDYLTSS